MFLSAIAFFAGHCAVHALPVLPPLWPWVGLGMVAVLGAGALRAWWLVAFLLGFLWAWSNAARCLADQLPSEATPVDAQVRGYISSLVDVDATGVGFVFDVLDGDKPVPKHLQLTWYDTDERPTPGELWELHVRLRRPRGFANPGGTDYTAQLFRSGLGATGYVRDAEHNRRLAAAGWRYSMLRVRGAIASKLATALPDSPMLGVVQGLAVGDTHRIGATQWRVFANTGTSHLMAISGLHIGMVAALMAWLSACLVRRFPLQRRQITVNDVSALTGMIAALAYSALAGLSVPTQRTLAMLLVYFGTRILRREIRITQGLSVALVAVLVVDPFAPLSAGFWLSFGAVTAIFIATSGRLARPPWAAEYLQLQAAVTVGLLPFLVGAFGGISVISPLVNLLAIPFFTFIIVPLVLVGTLLLELNTTLGGWVLHGVAYLLEAAWPLLDWASKLPLAMWHLPELPFWLAAFMLVGCLLAIAPGIAATRIAGAMLCLPALLWQPPKPSQGSFDLAVLDVGQGLAVVVTTQSHVLVYDAGPSFRSGRDTGELVVLPYLFSRGVRRIDTLMLSHGDNDHVGGARSLLAGLPINQVLVGPSVSLPQPVERCIAGQHWQWDQVDFQVLHPATGDAPSKNDSSCVLRIVGNAGDGALLLGDIEHNVESRLVANGTIQQADIVVVPHHGSRTSSTEVLTHAVAPKIAVISAGFGNRWGFPKPDVVARWHAVGARILSTSDSGAVEIAVGVTAEQANSIEVRAYRERDLAYWRQ